MRCTNCGCDNPDYAVVCEQCGAYLPKEEPAAEKKDSILDPIKAKLIRCSYCWGQNMASEELCRFCGMPLCYVPYPEEEGMYGDVPERPIPTVVETEDPSAPPVPEGMVRCRNCWKDSPDTAVTCEYCGYQLVSSKNGDNHYQKLRMTRNQTRYLPPGGNNAYADKKPSAKDMVGEAISLMWRERSLNLKELKRQEEEEQRRILRSKLVNKVNYSVPGTKRCRSCWFDNPPDAVICEQCGSKLGNVSTDGAVRVRTGAGRTMGYDASGRRICTCGYINLPRVTVCLKCNGVIVSDDELEDEGPRICTCGYQNLPGVTICLMCKGVVLKKCAKCGYESMPSVTICANCGTRFE